MKPSLIAISLSLLLIGGCANNVVDTPVDTPGEEFQSIHFYIDENNKFQVELHNCTMSEAAEMFIEAINKNWER